MPKPSLHLGLLIRRVVAIAVALTALSVLDPTLASAKQQIEVTGLRVGVHSNMTRVVLDVSGDVPFLVTPIGDGDTVIVEIPSVRWKTNSHRSIGRGLIRNYEYEGGDGSGFLALTTKGPVTVKKSFFLSPSSSGGYRIVIDLVSSGGYAKASTYKTVVELADRNQAPTVYDKSIVVAGTDREKLGDSVADNWRNKPRQDSAQIKIAFNGKYQKTAQRQPSPYQPQDLIGNRAPQGKPKQLSILRDMRDDPAKGFYMGAGAGYSFFSSGVSNLTGSAELDEESFSYKVFGGYKFNQFLSTELFYMDLGTMTLTGQTGDTFKFDGETLIFTQNTTVDAAITTIGIAGQLSYPLTPRISVFAKGGVHYWESASDFSTATTSESGSDDGLDLFYGVGAELSITKNVAVRGEYENFTVDNAEADIISISALFTF